MSQRAKAQAESMAEQSARGSINNNGIAFGGKAIYGANLGILMLEAAFPRIPGDMGHAGTWPFPVMYKVVRGASPERVVKNQAQGLLETFIAAGQELVRDGADGITTNCGFLSLFQAELAAALNVPVATSSLMQIAMVESMLPPGKRVGVITISKPHLSVEHLLEAGAPADTPVVGTESGKEFSRVILENETRLDIAAAEKDLLNAGRQLVQSAPDIGAVVLECTNMAPYSGALRQELGLPVFDIVSFISWFYAGLTPRTFPKH